MVLLQRHTLFLSSLRVTPLYEMLHFKKELLMKWLTEWQRSSFILMLHMSKMSKSEEMVITNIRSFADPVAGK